jgi:hypothetical protein
MLQELVSVNTIIIVLIVVVALVLAVNIVAAVVNLLLRLYIKAKGL